MNSMRYYLNIVEYGLRHMYTAMLCVSNCILSHNSTGVGECLHTKIHGTDEIDAESGVMEVLHAYCNTDLEPKLHNKVKNSLSGSCKA